MSMGWGEVETNSFQLAPLLSYLIDMFEMSLRGLILNSSDALDKIRYESLTDPSKLDTGDKLFIRIIPNENDCTLTIIDSGVGMTKTDLRNKLGSIVKSSTNASVDLLLGEVAHIKMIGQFSFGFYSAYHVADRIIVSSKHNDDQQYLWESYADGTFTIHPDLGEPLGRGTKIILFFNKNMPGLKEQKMKEIVKKLSQFIAYPIELVV